MYSHAVSMTVLVLLSVGATAATIPGDSIRGAALFTSQKCVSCHSVNGQGGHSAPDLAKRPSGQYTPTMMAAALWNHVPQMWGALAGAGIEKPKIGEQQIADLFAYFYALRYFEKPGDAARGKRILESKGCLGCHAHGISGAPPPGKWEAANNPIQLGRAMWNHAPRMRQAMGAKAKWPTLTAQDMTDISVYVRNIPGASQAAPTFSPASPQTGEVLFRVKGCAGCHTGKRALAGKLEAGTLAELSAAMWNHAPQMRKSAQDLRPEEMTRLVGYLWSIQHFEEPGSAKKGKKVLAEKGCDACHGRSGTGAPDFSTLAGNLDPIQFSSGVWKHGPDMLKKMNASGVIWPRFDGRELSNLLAYINSL